MDILTLELFDVTASQALRELRRALDEPRALRLHGEDAVVLHNVRRLLEREGRAHQVSEQGRTWRVDVAAPGAAPAPSPVPAPVAPAPVPVLRSRGPRPVLVLRGAYAPGDRVLGRRLLLGVLARVPEDTPWVCLAHDALDLLEDPAALEVLEGLEDRGIGVRVSEGSRAFHLLAPPFASMADAEWQDLAARGDLTVL